MIENTARPYSNLCYTSVRFGIFSCVIPVFFLYFNRLKIYYGLYCSAFGCSNADGNSSRHHHFFAIS